jgi:hypothetical protein
MKKIFGLAILFTLLSTSFVFSQTMYELNYKNKPLLLVRYEDGDGFIRAAYIDSSTQTKRFIQYQLTENIWLNAKGQPDTNTIALNLSNKENPGLVNWLPDFILFKLNPTTYYYEPFNAGNLLANGKNQISKFSKAPKLLSEADLSEAFLQGFFDESDLFYQNYTKSKTRGSINFGRNMPTLFVRIIADVEDNSIGKGCLEDKKNLYRLYTLIAQKLKIRLDTFAVMGKDYNRKSVENLLSNLNPGKNDIVMLHYTGHGFNRDDSTSPDPFPNLFLLPIAERKPWEKLVETKQKEAYESILRANTLSIQEIYSIVINKGARLNMVFSDCCNTDFRLRNLPSENQKKTRGVFTLYTDYCKSLFLDQTANILTAAVKKGEQAKSNPTDGSYYTLNYVQTLYKYLAPSFNPGDESISWNTILETTKKGTIEKTKKCYDKILKGPCVMNPMILVAPTQNN